MRLWGLFTLVVSLALATVLALLNPSMDDYARFLEAELGKALDRMDQTTPTREQQFIRHVFRTQSKKIIEGVVLPHTIRRNWGIFSLYETNALETRAVVLGVAGRMIPVQGVEEASLRLGRLAF